MQHFIYSTFTNDMTFHKFGPSDVGGGPNPILASVTIKGGANRATDKLFTPKGVLTIVDDAQMEILESHAAFRRHRDVSHRITVRDTQIDADKAAQADMQARDGSAPLTPDSEQFKKPNVGQPTKEKDSLLSRGAKMLTDLVGGAGEAA